MANAVLIVPPLLKVFNSPLLGPALLAGAARAGGHSVAVVDLNTAWILTRLPGDPAVDDRFLGDHHRPAALQAVEREWNSTLGWPEDVCPRTLAGATWDAVEEVASRLAAGPFGAWAHHRLNAELTPQLVGISVMYAGQVPAALAMTALVRKVWPSAQVLWGGAHVTALCDTIANERRYGDAADGFVFGYAEQTWVELLDAADAGAGWPAEVHRAGSGQSTRARDLPGTVPAFDIHEGQAPHTLPAQASRGCAFGKCAFCTYPSVEGRYRPLPFAPAEHVTRLAADLGAAVSFKDSLVIPRALEVLADRISGRVRWSACTKLHPKLDVEFLRRLRAGGCATLEVGLETLSSDNQELVGKHQSVELFLKVLDAADASGVSLVVNYMTGFPGADPVEEQAWLTFVEDQLALRPTLAAKIEHNRFELERASPMGRRPAAYGITATGSWPWSTVLGWQALQVPSSTAQHPFGCDDERARTIPVRRTRRARSTSSA